MLTIKGSFRLPGRLSHLHIFPSAEQGQLEDFKKTIHVLKSYIAKPLALCFNGGKNILLFIGTLIVGFLDLVSCFSRGCVFVKTQKVIDEEAVKKSTP